MQLWLDLSLVHGTVMSATSVGGQDAQAARTAKLSGLMSATLARATAIFCSRKKAQKITEYRDTAPLPTVEYRRLPGCVVMGINRTRRLFGRQKKNAWAASQYTLYGFRPRCYHFLSPLFLIFSLWSKKLHIRYAHRYSLDIYDTLEQSKKLSRRGF